MEDDNTDGEIDFGTAEQGFIDDSNDYGEYVQDVQEDQQFGSYPGVKPKESIFTFFKHIVGIKDSTKVANLDKRELGMLDLSVRNCEYLAKLGNQLHNKSYHDFFMTKAEVTLATSMSKKGWLPELVVSQKRFSQRTVQPITAPAPQKKGFFGNRSAPAQQ